MALTAKRREEMAKELDVASTWISNRGRSGKIRAIAAELRGEDVEETDDADTARLEAAKKAEDEAQEVRQGRRGAAKSSE